MATRRAQSPAHRGQRMDRGRSVRVDEDGNVENPYAQLGEWVNERLHGAKPHASDGQRYAVEVVAWAQIIDTALGQIDNRLHTGQQHSLADDSVNFIINSMEHSNMSAVSSKVRALPAGCEMRMGDVHENGARASGVARRPKGREFFINVTERAQANLESRRKTNKRMRIYDTMVFILSIVGIVVFAIMLYKHGEDYRHPFATLTQAAGTVMSFGEEAETH